MQVLILGNTEKTTFLTKLEDNLPYSDMSVFYSFCSTEFPTVVHA